MAITEPEYCSSNTTSWLAYRAIKKYGVDFYKEPFIQAHMLIENDVNSCIEHLPQEIANKVEVEIL